MFLNSFITFSIFQWNRKKLRQSLRKQQILFTLEERNLCYLNNKVISNSNTNNGVSRTCRCSPAINYNDLRASATSQSFYMNIKLTVSLIIVFGYFILDMNVSFAWYCKNLSGALPNSTLIIFLTAIVWLLLFKSLPSLIIVIHLDCVNRNINYIHKQLKEYISRKSCNSHWAPNFTVLNSLQCSAPSKKSSPPSLVDIRQQYKRIANHFKEMNDIILTPLGFSHVVWLYIAITNTAYAIFNHSDGVNIEFLICAVTSAIISAVAWIIQAHMADDVAQQASDLEIVC